MANSLLEAIKLDLESNYMSVKSPENWQAICQNVLLTSISCNNFTNDSFNNTRTYVSHKSKEDIINEMKSYAYKGQNILRKDELAKSAASGIVYNIINPSIKEEQNEVDIVSLLCSKIDSINANQGFKDYIKNQIKDGTITEDELRRYNIITPDEINAYFSQIKPKEESLRFS